MLHSKESTWDDDVSSVPKVRRGSGSSISSFSSTSSSSETSNERNSNEDEKESLSHPVNADEPLHLPKEATLKITPQEDNARKWSAIINLGDISNMASLLCVLDCTILPVLTVLMPMVGITASAAASNDGIAHSHGHDHHHHDHHHDSMEWIHEFGHSMALYFVLPVGIITTGTNYFSHKSRAILGFGLLGIIMIYAANGGNDAPLLNRLPHEFVHALHCGSWLHRLVNITGCSLLLGCNYLSHRRKSMMQQGGQVETTKTAGDCLGWCLCPKLFQGRRKMTIRDDMRSVPFKKYRGGNKPKKANNPSVPGEAGGYIMVLPPGVSLYCQ